MRAVVQRVGEAAVTVGGEVVGAIGPGCACWWASPTTTTAPRPQAGRADLAPAGDGRRRRRDEPSASPTRPARCWSSASSRSTATRAGGRRPSWIAAARPEHAEPLIDAVVERLRELGATVATGRFRTEMRVALVNDGPVTVLLET